MSVARAMTARPSDLAGVAVESRMERGWRNERRNDGRRSHGKRNEIFIFVHVVLQRATERCTATSAGPTGWKSAGRGKIDCHSCAISTSLPPGPISET